MNGIRYYCTCEDSEYDTEDIALDNWCEQFEKRGNNEKQKN